MFDARTRYVSDAVTTVGPARLLTMLYDRLLLDIDRATQALSAGDRPGGSAHLQHAQDIVAELMASLDETVWDGAAGLMDVYRFVFASLVDAGVRGDAGLATSCRELVAPLAEAWHEAARQVAVPAVPAVPAPAAAFDAAPAGSGLLGVG